MHRRYRGAALIHSGRLRPNHQIDIAVQDL